MPKIELIPQKLGLSERGGSANSYPSAKRQVRRRLEEIDKQIAELQARKEKLLSA